MAKLRKNQKPRLNDDWSYLDEGERPEHPTTDQQFNITYKTSGMQSISNIKIEQKKAPREATNDPEYSVAVTSRTINREDVSLKRIQETEALTKKKLKARGRIARISIRMLTWYGWVWLVQLIFAIVGTIAFATIAAADSASSGIFSFLGVGAKFVSDAVGFVTGFNIGDVIEALYLLSWGVIVTIGILSLIIMQLQYKLSGINSLSGEKGGLKIIAFGISLILYFFSLLPVIGAIPWIVVWMYVVWKYPK